MILPPSPCMSFLDTSFYFPSLLFLAHRCSLNVYELIILAYLWLVYCLFSLIMPKREKVEVAEVVCIDVAS